MPDVATVIKWQLSWKMPLHFKIAHGVSVCFVNLYAAKTKTDYEALYSQKFIK